MNDEASIELCNVVYAYLDGHSVGDMLELIATVIQTKEYQESKTKEEDCEESTIQKG